MEAILKFNLPEDQDQFDVAPQEGWIGHYLFWI